MRDEIGRIKREQFAFQCSGAGCASTRARATYACSATCRSTSRRVRGDVGASRSVPARHRRGPDRRRRACRRTTSPHRTAVGQSALRLGRPTVRSSFPVARRASRRSSSASTCCDSITSARSPRTGRCRRARPMRAAVNGGRPRVRSCWRGCGTIWRPAAGGRGPRCHHGGCRRCTQVRAAGHARAAVWLRRRSRQPAPAARIRARLRRLHRHARQRHRHGLVSPPWILPPGSA